MLRFTSKQLTSYYRNINRTEFVSHPESYKLHLITKDDPDSKCVNARKSLEEILDHPLAQRFKRNQISLYTAPDSFWQEVRKRGVMPSPSIMIGKKIILPRGLVYRQSTEEVKAVIAHEVAHHLHLDNHPKRNWKERLFDVKRQQNEKFADTLAVVLGASPDALISGLHSVYAYSLDRAAMRIQAQHVFEPDVAEEIIARHKHSIQNRPKENNYYKNLDMRAEHIRDTASKLFDPNQRDLLLSDIADELVQKHKTLFPNQFARNIENKRAISTNAGNISL